MKLIAITLRLLVVLFAAGPRLAWCVPELDLDVSLDPTAGTISVNAAITTDAPVLNFYLANNFVVQSVELDGATIPTNRSILEGSQQFQIDFPDAQQTRTVTVRYHGKLHALDTSLTHEETLQALPAMSSAQGAYLPGDAGWYPITDSAFTYRLTIAVPQGQVAVAPGKPSDETTTDGIRKATFTMNWPVDQLDVMAGPWSVRERQIKVADAPVRIRTYFGAAEASLADSYLDATEAFIQRYAARIGPYPYTVFSVVSSPIPTGFGMPTLTYLGSQVLGYPFIRDISLGHEILHSWWGTGVRVDPIRGNWAEGLTTFMADYAFREEESPLAAMRMRHGWLRDYAALPPDMEQPLSSFRARYHTASATIGYGKSAMMFFALRKRIGKEAFSTGIRTFWEKYQHASASFDNLREAFEQASGQSLTGFFDQWLDRTGAPRLSVSRARMSTDGKSEVKLEISQDANPYDLSVPLRLFVDDNAVDTRVHLTAATQELAIPVEKLASALQIDPQFEVWRQLAASEAPPILRDLIAAKSVQVVVPGKPAGQNSNTKDIVATDIVRMVIAFTEANVTAVDPAQKTEANIPLIIAGSKAAVNSYLKEHALAPRPAEVTAGAVEVWTLQDAARKVAVIAIEAGAENNKEMSNLGERLRHFGSYGWVSIATTGKTARGNWPIESPRYKIAR